MPLRKDVVEIPFTSPLHAQVLEAIRQREAMSRHYMSDRYESWREMEERFRAYVNLKENDRARKEMSKQGRPQYVTIDVPYSYAMLLTAHTYWTSVFLARQPVLQFQARSGQTMDQEQAMESLIDYQMTAGGALLPLCLWFMDAGKYGLGVIGNSWLEEKFAITDIVEVPKTYLGIDLGGTKKVKQTKLISGYKGNKVFNIRPQDFRPDPRVSLANLQQGEFCGRMVEVGWNTVLKRQQDGWYFNVEELQKRIKAEPGAWTKDTGSPQLVLPAGMDTLYNRGRLDDAKTKDKKEKSYIQNLEMTIELVPSDWGLGPSQYPEKWVFTVANDEVILCAMPQGALHNRFEYFPLEYEIEGYALAKRSLLEIVDPLNNVLSWLFNSHMYNVRKALNDQIIVDPSRVTMKDFTDPDAGRLVRLKPEAYGTDVRATHVQLQVNDLTRTHLNDFTIVADIMHRVAGTNDNIMGMVNPGGRKTATEIRTSSTLGINRLKTNCEYLSSMGFTPWAETVLQNTQQRFDENTKMRIVGARANPMQGSAPYVDVSPEAIAGKWGFVPVDGTMPIDRFAQANLWKELAMATRQMPEVAQQMDWMGIMGWIAQLSGMKNFDQFRINVVPDGAAAQQAQAGNVVPIPGGGGGGRPGGGRPGGAGAPGSPSVPGTPSVSGVGRTG